LATLKESNLYKNITPVIQKVSVDLEM